MFNLKKIVLSYCLSLSITFLSGQSGITPQTFWRFVKGDSITVNTDYMTNLNYGVQGYEAEGNNPGGRKGCAKWIDKDGNIWLFGGMGTSAIDDGLLNDLWKYNIISRQWIFIKGDNIVNVVGVYGVQGLESNDNNPGSRKGAVSWIDNEGNLWLFGGYGYYTSGAGLLNDLWKYNPSTNNWTWIDGDNSRDVPGFYGQKGRAALENNPGGRQNSIGWQDSTGDFWIFGGEGYAAENISGMLNDLWKYNHQTNNWIWINGDSIINVPGLYGTQGNGIIDNHPGSRSACVWWTDRENNFWLFSGYGTYSAGFGWFNDLWKYNPITNIWTWMKGDSANVTLTYGVQGVASPFNQPGARNSGAGCTDSSGNFWLFGGYGYAENSFGKLNDLWKYNTQENVWTWVKGDKIANQIGSYGIKNVDNILNNPPPRIECFAVNNKDNNLWFFGGEGNSNGEGDFNDLWEFNIESNLWTWTKGDSLVNIKGIYGTQGLVGEGNRPEQKAESVSWIDKQGNFWLFGGENREMNNPDNRKLHNDLWKFNFISKQWVWMKGSINMDVNGEYGQKGIEAGNTTPGARRSSTSWSDSSGTFWLFGGYGYAANGSLGYLNDLWKFNIQTNNWTWVSGDSTANSESIYGNKTVAAASNCPGGRNDCVSWADAAGNFWLFGGSVFNAAEEYINLFNDLWKYDPVDNLWTWMNGDSLIGIFGSYGIKGVFDIANKPGARHRSVSWMDTTGNLWLFGGNNSVNRFTDGYLNDLWKYDPQINQWVWVSGTDSINKLGKYVSQGFPSEYALPGGKSNSTAWTDGTDNLYLFGGFGNYASGEYVLNGSSNDIWKYNIAQNNWTWVEGDSISTPYFREKGKADTVNNSGPRTANVSWVDTSGNVWVYGDYWRNDLIEYDLSAHTWTLVKGENSSMPGIFGIQGESRKENKPGARNSAVSWIDLNGDLWLFGGQETSWFGGPFNWNDLWKFNPASKQWTWVKGDSTSNEMEVYGMKGIGAIGNTPGGRSGSVSWTDTLGNLWLFGGEMMDLYASRRATFNDVWKFNTSTREWAWMKGDSIPDAISIYGTSGIPNIQNTPGTRYGSVSWVDNNGKFWLFGGRGMIGDGFEYGGRVDFFSNELWKYDPDTNMWTWYNGDSTAAYSSNVSFYGIKGVPSVNNRPCPRKNGIGWTDKLGKLWLFGGENFTTADGIRRYNDVWKFDPETSMWTWIGGDSTFNTAIPIYGVPGVEDSNNTPGSYSGSICWKDVFDNVYVFGGETISPIKSGYTNELWRYNTVTNHWTFINGEFNVHSNVNRPGARSNAVSWADSSGTLWLFGGYGYGSSGESTLNDLWKIYSGTEYKFTGNGDWDTASNWINNLVAPTTIGPGINVTIDHLIPGACINNGPITLLPYGLLKVESGKKLTINQGDLSNSGSILGPGNRPGRLNFRGTNLNSLQSSGSITTPIILDNNKQMFLSDNSKTSRLELSGGSKLNIGDYNLFVDTASVIADSVSFVITSGSGSLSRIIKDEPSLFPVGTASNSYTPLKISMIGAGTDSFSVRVKPGVRSKLDDSGIDITTGNVDRTWIVNNSSAIRRTGIVELKWNAADTQPLFNRTNCYISQADSCAPPPNCQDIYYDSYTRGPASGSDPYTLTRDSVDQFRAFIVKSSTSVYVFKGIWSSDWNDPNNWEVGIVPCRTEIENGVVNYIVENGTEIIIDYPVGGQCVLDGNLVIEPGSRVTVMDGKVLTVTGSVITH